MWRTYQCGAPRGVGGSCPCNLGCLVRWRLFAVRRLFAGPGPFSTSRAALATIFGSAGLSCSTDEPPVQRKPMKAGRSTSCGRSAHCGASCTVTGVGALARSFYAQIGEPSMADSPSRPRLAKCGHSRFLCCCYFMLLNIYDVYNSC